MNDREKYLLIGAVAFSVITFGIAYLFSLTNLGFSDAFNLNIFQKLFVGNTILYLIIVGALFAADTALLVWITNKLKDWDPSIVGVAGSIIAFALGAGLHIYSTINSFGIFMFFYALGSFYVAHKTWDISGKGLSRAGAVYNASKRFMMIMAVGGLIGGIIITSSAGPYYQGLIKSNVIGFASGINLGSLITKDDVRQLVISQELTQAEITKAYTDSCNSDPSCSSLPDNQKQTYIQQQATKAYQAQTANLDKTVDSVYSSFQQKSSFLPTLTSDIIDRFPLTRVILNVLPIFIGLILYSAVATFGTIVVGPFSALFGLFLKK